MLFEFETYRAHHPNTFSCKYTATIHGWVFLWVAIASCKCAAAAIQCHIPHSTTINQSGVLRGAQDARALAMFVLLFLVCSRANTSRPCLLLSVSVPARHTHVDALWFFLAAHICGFFLVKIFSESFKRNILMSVVVGAPSPRVRE